MRQGRLGGGGSHPCLARYQKLLCVRNWAKDLAWILSASSPLCKGAQEPEAQRGLRKGGRGNTQVCLPPGSLLSTPKP